VDVIQVGIGMLLLIGVGFTLSRFELLSTDEFKSLGVFTTKFAFPFLFFRSLASKKFRDLSLLPLADALLMSVSVQLTVAIVSLIVPVRDRLYTYLSTVISSAYINYIIIGLPIFRSIWGTHYDHVPAICALAHYVLLVPLFLILAQLWKIKKAKAENPDAAEGQRLTARDVGNAFVTTLKTPLLIGIVIGLGWSAIGIGYPVFVEYIARYMGDIVLVFAMCGIGRFLQVRSMLKCNWIQLIGCLCIRFFLAPGFAALYAWALRFGPTMARQCTILSCLPAANAGFVLGNSVGIGPDVASAMVFWTLILIVPVLIFWNFLLDRLNLFIEVQPE
jgi:predicted permease